MIWVRRAGNLQEKKGSPWVTGPGDGASVGRIHSEAAGYIQISRRLF